MDTPKTDKVIADFNKKILDDMKLNVPDSSGKLKSSLDISSSKDIGGFTVSMSMEDYGIYVDQGRKPGKGIPVDALKKWIVNRKMVIKDSEGKTVRATESRIDGLAYVINKKIKEEGIKPTYFITNAIDKYLSQFATDVADAYGDDLIDSIF